MRHPFDAAKKLDKSPPEHLQVLWKYHNRRKLELHKERRQPLENHRQHQPVIPGGCEVAYSYIDPQHGHDPANGLECGVCPCRPILFGLPQMWPNMISQRDGSARIHQDSPKFPLPLLLQPILIINCPTFVITPSSRNF